MLLLLHGPVVAGLGEAEVVVGDPGGLVVVALVVAAVELGAGAVGAVQVCQIWPQALLK